MTEQVWDASDAQRGAKLQEALDKLASGAMNDTEGRFFFDAVLAAEAEKVNHGSVIASDVLQLLVQFIERGLLADESLFENMVQKQFASFYMSFLTAQVQKSKSTDQSATEAVIAAQKQLDMWLDVVFRAPKLAAVLVSGLLAGDERQFKFLATFRMVTLKRFADMLAELERWNLEALMKKEQYILVVEQLEQQLRKMTTKFLEQGDKLDNSFAFLSLFPPVEVGGEATQFSAMFDEVRLSLVMNIVEARKVQQWGARETAVFGEQFLALRTTKAGQSLMRRWLDRVKAELEMESLMAYPEKLMQWFATMETKFEGDKEWWGEVRARVLSAYLLEDNLQELSLKRVKWLAGLKENDFCHDERSAELKTAYTIVTKLQYIYGFLTEGGYPKPEDVYRPKNDEFLRDSIQQHIRGQIIGNKVDLTKNRPVVTVAFYNNGKYDVKGMLRFVAEQRKTAGEYYKFIIWLYGDKPIRAELDQAAQRELTKDIEWFIEMEIVPNKEDVHAKILKECEHVNIRRLFED